MEFGGASSLVLLMAIGLWVAYLVPSLVRRRNYASTERNAVRLQQALRALAETAEVPTDLRAETTRRGVAEQERRVKGQQRKLKKAQQAAEQAERKRLAVAEKALPTVRMPRDANDRRRAAAATRRGRLVTTFVMLAGLGTAGFGVWFGLQSGNWWVLVGGAVAVLGAIAMLQRLARVAAAQRFAAERQAAAARAQAEAEAAAAAEPAAQAYVAQAVTDLHVEREQVATAAMAEPATTGWTPIAVPKPLYLRETTTGGPDGGPQGPEDGRHVPTFDIEALRAAARASEQAIRDAHHRPGVATFGRGAVATTDHDARGAVEVDPYAETMPLGREVLANAVQVEPIEAPAGRLAARPSPWDRMGRLDGADGEAPVLRRRHAS